MYANIIIHVHILRAEGFFLLGLLTTKYAQLVVALPRKMGGQLPCILHVIMGRPGLSTRSDWCMEGLFYCRYFGESVDGVFRSRQNWILEQSGSAITT